MASSALRLRVSADDGRPLRVKDVPVFVCGPPLTLSPGGKEAGSFFLARARFIRDVYDAWRQEWRRPGEAKM